MKVNCNNIYRIARKSSVNPKTGKAYTVENVAELVPISERSIAYYESGEMIPQDDVVCRLIELYGAKWLAYAHMQQNSLVGNTYLPKINYWNLSESVLNLQVGMNDVASKQFDLIQIAADGIISNDEVELWEKNKQALSKLTSNLLSILFLKEA